MLGVWRALNGGGAMALRLLVVSTLGVWHALNGGGARALRLLDVSTLGVNHGGYVEGARKSVGYDPWSAEHGGGPSVRLV